MVPNPDYGFFYFCHSMKKIALIVAGGSGKRMGHEVPKQFLELSNRPVLMLTIEKFRHICNEIILVLPFQHFAYWKRLCEIHHFSIPYTLVEGGEQRLQSVANGLAAVPNGCLVAIHDGVRPLVSESIINASFLMAEQQGNAVTSVKLKDSIREVKEGESKALLRENYMLIQTPQTFQSKRIKEAYTRLIAENIELTPFSDDASVAEYYGESINLIEGSYGNIKITTPEDLLTAEVLIKSS